MKRKMFGRIAATALGVSLVGTSAMFALASCAPDQGGISYVSLDINPSVEMVLDKDNKVLSVTADNEDGQVLLYGEESFKGQTVEEAVDRIAKLSYELGYVSEDNKVVEMTVSGSMGNKKEESLKSAVTAQFAASSASFGFSLSVSTEGSYSLNRALLQIKAEYPDNKDIQNLDVAEYKLILAAQAGDGSLTVETAVKLNNKELLEKAAAAKAQVKETATRAYEIAKEQAELAYRKAKITAMDGIYTTYYLKNKTLEPNYGALYQGYGLMADSFELAADGAEFAVKTANTALDKAMVQKVAAALKMSDEEMKKLENADGEVTLESILAYADVKFKNSEAGEQLEQMKKDLDKALTEAETYVKTEAQRIVEEYKDEINVAVTAVNGVIETAKAACMLLPESVRNTAVVYFNEFSDSMKIVSNMENISVESLRKTAASFREKQNAMEETIKKDLTAEELAEVQKMRDEAEAKLNAVKAEADQKIAAAEQAAKDYLASLKAERKNAQAA